LLAKQHFTTEQAREFGEKFGFDWDLSSSDDEQLPMEFGFKLKYGANSSFSIRERKANRHHRN
jgi:hypothetical protein